MANNVVKEQTPRQIREQAAYEAEKDAKRFIRKMMKKYDLERYAGHIVNYIGRYELFTNF